jgi:hypothetical protein
MRYIGFFTLGALAVFMFGALLDASGSHDRQKSPSSVTTHTNISLNRIHNQF